jgi:hypothetical protein
VEPVPEWRGAGGGGVLTDEAELLQEHGVEERDPRASEHRIEMELPTQHGWWGGRRRPGAVGRRTEGAPAPNSRWKPRGILHIFGS